MPPLCAPDQGRGADEVRIAHRRYPGPIPASAERGRATVPKRLSVSMVIFWGCALAREALDMPSPWPRRALLDRGTTVPCASADACRRTGGRGEAYTGRSA